MIRCKESWIRKLFITVIFVFATMCHTMVISCEKQNIHSIILIIFLCSVFNLGEYRRRVTQMYKNHNFFRSDNEEAMALRQRCALDALEDVCEWLETEAGEVAVSG